ncbi:hypothetical protein [Acidovorax sp. LjRoot117]|uniref:hypothetical protein n=1 Tax=Acidovorax sp. LjRoot117 TaxID=3342255 RepID=UPI003ED159B8
MQNQFKNSVKLAAVTLLLIIFCLVDAHLIRSPIFGLVAIFLCAPVFLFKGIFHLIKKDLNSAKEYGIKIVFCVALFVVSIVYGIHHFDQVERDVKRIGEQIREAAANQGYFSASLHEFDGLATDLNLKNQKTFIVRGVPITYRVDSKNSNAFLHYWYYGSLGQMSFDIKNNKFSTAVPD